VDLREGTPFGNLFDALLDLAIAFPADALPRAGGRPRGASDSLLDDLAKASRQWPGKKKLKVICRLMRGHPSIFPQYRSVGLEALYKRAKQRIAEETFYRNVEEGEPILAPSNKEVLEFFTWGIQKLARQAEARRARKKSAPVCPPSAWPHALLRKALAYPEGK
jgi:hypothetical protein